MSILRWKAVFKEDFGRALEAQRLARVGVEAPGDGVELALAVDTQVHSIRAI